MSSDLFRTPLHDFHAQRGGKMIAFAGYALPVFYAGGGLLAEHRQTREQAAIFDVSHMGQVVIRAGDAALASLAPVDLAAIPVGASKYTFLTNADGGVIDDCIVSNDGERGWFVVLNASRKAVDLARIRAAMPDPSLLTELSDRALLAIQGPSAAAAVGDLFPDAPGLKFMRGCWREWEGAECRVSRCGYTGEDGFEISVPAAAAVKMAEKLAENPAVGCAGLGARDSLRLEAGLCLYGNELDEATSPIEAGLTWAIPRALRAGGSYPGADVIARQIADGAPRRLIGLRPQGRAPARQGATVLSGGEAVGAVASGTFSPTLESPIALAYVRAAAAAEDFDVDSRGKIIPCGKAAPLPFVPHRYAR